MQTAHTGYLLDILAKRHLFRHPFCLRLEPDWVFGLLGLTHAVLNMLKRDIFLYHSGSSSFICRCHVLQLQDAAGFAESRKKICKRQSIFFPHSLISPTKSCCNYIQVEALRNPESDASIFTFFTNTAPVLL